MSLTKITSNVASSSFNAPTATKLAAAPAFSAYMSAATQTITSGVFTKIQLQTEEFDTNSSFDNSTNYRFQPTVTGYYQISGAAVLSGSVSTSSAIVSIYKGTSPSSPAEFKRGTQIISGTATGAMDASVSSLVYLNGSTDYVELWGYCIGAGTVSVYGNPTGNGYSTYFQGILVKPA